MLAVVLSYRIHRQIRTPSGDSIGKVAERGTHLAEVNTALTVDIHKAVGGNGEITPMIEEA